MRDSLENDKMTNCRKTKNRSAFANTKINVSEGCVTGVVHAVLLRADCHVNIEGLRMTTPANILD